MNPVEYLADMSDDEVVYLPNPGNAGDSLIFCATLQQFNKLGVRYEMYQKNMSLKGRVLVYGGGGNLVSYYDYARNILGMHHREVSRLVILPHTIDSHVDLLNSFGDNVDIFCRELITYEYVKKQAIQANVFISHDMALGFDTMEFFKSYCTHVDYAKAMKQNLKFALVALSGGFRGVSRFITGSRLDAYRVDIESRQEKVLKGNLDLSNIFHPMVFDEKYSVESVCSMMKVINKYKAIYTDRLHVMILSALMDKDVYFFSGAYYKNEAVYQYSIASRFPNVHFVK